tara:strand:+ start:444 stop:713 length:270 start_codon:yes stop_codon:yes gene_type:complete
MVNEKHKKILEEVLNHCSSEKGTTKYGKDVEVVDLLSSTGDLMSFCKGNVIKYVSRHGKKTEMNDPSDLFKAIHYILIMLEEMNDADNA